jgi:hypothetical protein
MNPKRFVIKNDCGAFVSGYNSILEESIVTRCEKDFKFFNSREEAQKFIDKCYYEDDMEIIEWVK